MKYLPILSLAAAATAFVVPDAEVFGALEVQPRVPSDSERIVGNVQDAIHHAVDEVDDAISQYAHAYDRHASTARKAWHDASSQLDDASSHVNEYLHNAGYDASSWLKSAKDSWEKEVNRGVATLERALQDSTAHHDRPHHHHGPNETVYQLIAKSKYTTKLAALINKYDDLVEALNGTSANFTVFAPSNKAFEKIPKHAPEPSKKFLKSILSYHVSADFYPAGRILVSKTIPTLLNSSALGKEPMPQRLSTNIGLRGLTVNIFSKVIKADIFGTNGVIHAIDSILVPPPSILKIIDLLPSEFSTLELGLGKTGLYEALNTTDHAGGTFFAPNNYAFTKLGPRINAFLFSPYGTKYLKALLSYHVVPSKTLYSDAFYDGASESGVDASNIPKGFYHVDLPTLLENRSLAVDISRYGRLIAIDINKFTRVKAADGVAYDGVLHVITSVLIPPKKLPGSSEAEYWNGSDEMTVEDLKERLEPYVESTPQYQIDL